MVRQYTAVMALVGIVVVLLRAIKDGAGFDGAIANGLVSMVLLGAIGMVVAIIAQQTVDESVRTTIEAELVAASAGETPEPTKRTESQ